MPQDTNLLRLPEVVERVGFGKSTIYALIKRGQFPSPIALGARARAWISTEVDAWIAQRILETRGATKSARLDGQPAAMSPERTA
jgi:prophage regulatory protein